MIYIVAISIIPFAWLFIPWKNKYFYGETLVDEKVYGDKNPFKIPLRKIYRPRHYSEMDYDIYVLQKVDRFKKTVEYILANIDDEPSIINQLKEQSNG